jgi:hypothetical protein
LLNVGAVLTKQLAVSVVLLKSLPWGFTVLPALLPALPFQA